MDNVANLSSANGSDRPDAPISGNLYMAVAIVYCTFYLIISLFPFMQPDSSDALSQSNLAIDALFIIPIVLAFLCSAIAFLRSEKYKQTWLLVLISMLFWLAPEALNMYLYDINTGFVDPAMSSNVNSLYYGFFLIFPMAILVRVYMHLRSGYRRLNLLINLGIVLSTMLGLFNVILELQNSGTLLNGWLVGLGYLLFAIAVLYAIYFSWSSLHGTGLHVWEKYLIIALGFLFLANIFYLLQADVGIYGHGTVYELGWLLGAYLIGAAALVDSKLLGSSALSNIMTNENKQMRHPAMSFYGPLLVGSINLLVLYFVAVSPQGEHSGQIAGFLAAVTFFASVQFYLTRKENLFLNSNTYRDILTNVYSKSFFVEMLEHQYESAKRYDNELVLLIIKVDNLNEVVGEKDLGEEERILSKIAGVLGLMVRNADIICRVSAFEFAVLMPEAKFDQIHAIADRIRISIADESIGDSGGAPVTVSIGVTHYPRLADDPKGLFESAQAAISEARTKGDNIVVIAESVAVKPTESEAPGSPKT